MKVYVVTRYVEVSGAREVVGVFRSREAISLREWGRYPIEIKEYDLQEGCGRCLR